MHITRRQLRRIIKEELKRSLREDIWDELDDEASDKPPEVSSQEKAAEFVSKWKETKDDPGREGLQAREALFTEYGVIKHAQGKTDDGALAHKIYFDDGQSFIVTD
jgi:hypothetical protein